MKVPLTLEKKTKASNVPVVPEPDLVARLVELKRVHNASIESRLAALNILEDAVAARQVAERETEERRRVEKILRETNQKLVSEISQRKKSEAQRLELLRQLAGAEENERRRISRELHDGVGQHLAALIMSLQAMEADKAFSAESVRAARKMAERVSREIHDLALELRPSALDDTGLVRALSSYVEEWSAKTKIHADFQSIGLGRRRLPAAVETAVYRIAQEALTNVLKHARAKNVSLILERRGNLLSMIVEDDGRGFSTKQLEKNKMAAKLGVLGMRERATMLEGELTVESKPTRGTTIFVRFPLPQKKARG